MSYYPYRDQEVLEQLTCEECGSVYHTPMLGPNEFRWKNICDGCRPEPEILTYTITHRIVKDEIQEG